MRQYIAYADNGRDYFNFEFYSDHRANSKANKEDAIWEYRRKHGHFVRVITTWLVKGE